MERGQRLIGLNTLEYPLSVERRESAFRENVRHNAVDADPKKQQQDDDPDRNGSKLDSPVFAIVHSCMISCCLLLGSHCSFLRGCA